ncbi:MAG: Hsp70 family protein [Caldilineaceae bacterium]|nr:Hsp70 family protein [Caldilineaceae bacterium]
MANADDNMLSSPIIGIDLGTTNSVLAIVEDGAPRLIPVDGSALLPSVVGLDSKGDILVGHPARNQWVAAPERTVRSVKRKMGSSERISMGDQLFTPQEISAFILRAIAEAARTELGQPVTRAVITVPAYFTEVQRQATIEAGAIAGLEVERIINEPTAAALAYGYGVGIADEHRRILVVDLGGGTFDVSIIDLNYGVVDVLATGGDNLLGGDDFDETLAVMLADEFEEEHGINLREDRRAWSRLLRAAEEGKIALSQDGSADIALEFLAEDSAGRTLHLHREVRRWELEELLESFLHRIAGCIDQTLADAGLKASDIDRVLLVGGSTRIPAVAELIAERLHQEPHMEIDPDTAVALGAAVQAAIIAGEEIDAILVDVTPFSLGIEAAEFGINGRINADRFSVLIRRNTTIPARHSDIYHTLHPAQDAIHVKVYQGESARASDNVLLGDFMVENLRPAPGEYTASVTINFNLTIDGILEVTVTDRTTGKQISEQLKAERRRLTPEQIAASQAKLSSLVTTRADDALSEEQKALIGRAEALLDGQDDRGDASLSDDVAAVIAAMREAAREGETELLEELEEELVDLLMEAEG